jgi:hypothetical protein
VEKYSILGAGRSNRQDGDGTKLKKEQEEAEDEEEDEKRRKRSKRRKTRKRRQRRKRKRRTCLPTLKNGNTKPFHNSKAVKRRGVAANNSKLGYLGNTNKSIV